MTVASNMRSFQVLVPTMNKCACCDRDDKSFQLLTRVVRWTVAGFVTARVTAVDLCQRCDRAPQEAPA